VLIKLIIEMKKSVALILFSLVIFSNSYSQTEEQVVENVTFIENAPEYPGGLQNFYDYIIANVKVSKKQMKKLKGGQIFIQFVINEEGYVDKESVSSIKGMTTIDDIEVISMVEDIIKDSPKWTVGTRNGDYKEMRQVIPISF